jgi:2-C-methyl-D-erythritol 2,4-cyclodiphosphate synthase
MKIGIGYDVHGLTAGRKLIIGGVSIPFAKGLTGHSDADVLLHALCDALLGAAGLDDIGCFFPDTDPKYKNISSIKLLEKTTEIIDKNNLCLVNADAVLLAEAPRLAPYKKAMQRNIAEAMQVNTACINIKATTSEGLGFIGKGEGIAAMCVVLLAEKGGTHRQELP